MDILERPARLRIKGIWICLWMLTACRQNTHTIPDTVIPLHNSYIQRDGGILYYSGKPYSGRMMDIVASDTLEKQGYINGKAEGKWEKFYPGGQKKEVRYFLRGKKTGCHEGWYPNGSLKFRHHYKEDVYEGSVEDFAADGSPQKAFHYKNGQESGMQKSWYSDGTIHMNYEARNVIKYGLTGVHSCVSAADSLRVR